MPSSDRSMPVVSPKRASFAVNQPWPHPRSKILGRSIGKDPSTERIASWRHSFHKLTVFRSRQFCQCQSQNCCCSIIVGTSDLVLLRLFTVWWVLRQKSRLNPTVAALCERRFLLCYRYPGPTDPSAFGEADFLHANVSVKLYRVNFAVSGKYATPLLEYLDRQRVTRRVEDERTIL